MSTKKVFEELIENIVQIIDKAVKESADRWRSKLNYANQERDRYQKGWQDEVKKTEQLQSENERLRVALEGLYEHTKNNYQICGLNQKAKEALKETKQ